MARGISSRMFFVPLYIGPILLLWARVGIEPGSAKPAQDLVTNVTELLVSFYLTNFIESKNL